MIQPTTDIGIETSSSQLFLGLHETLGFNRRHYKQKVQEVQNSVELFSLDIALFRDSSRTHKAKSTLKISFSSVLQHAIELNLNSEKVIFQCPRRATEHLPTESAGQ